MASPTTCSDLPTGENFQLEGRQKCAVCWHTHSDPRLLEQCLHSFCASCIDHLSVSAEESGFVSCPVCSTKCRLPLAGAVGLPKDIALSPDQDPIAELRCEGCASDEESEIRFSCTTCHALLCSEHALKHIQPRLSPSDHHSIEAFDPTSHRQRVSKRDARSTPGRACQTHGQALRFFCIRCDVAVCGDCALVGDHSSLAHKPVKSIQEEVQRRKDFVLLDVARLRDGVCGQLEASLASVRKASDDLATCRERVEGEVRAAGERAAADLQSCVQKMLQDVDDFATSQSKCLHLCKEELEQHLNATRRALRFSDRIMEYDSATDEFFPLLSALERRAKGLLQEPMLFSEARRKNMPLLALGGCDEGERKAHASAMIGKLDISDRSRRADNDTNGGQESE